MLHLDPEIEAKYEVLSKMAEGGMGSVYKVRHRRLEEIRVIKTAKFSDHPGEKERFFLEAKIGSQLSHSNIARITDYDITREGTVYIVMEYVDGLTARQVLATEGPLDALSVSRIALQTLEALQYLHDRGLVHRDVAPDNIMVTRDATGQPLAKLIDLGIAKSMSARESLTESGRFIGKVLYAAPEQFNGEVDTRSDLYSLGIVMYELLTGAPPFPKDDYRAVIAAHISGQLLPFEQTDTDGRVPRNVRDVVMRALKAVPHERFQSAAEFARALRDLDRVAEAETTSFVVKELAAVKPPDGVPTQLGRYTVLEQIAAGKTGRLYKAFDPVRGRLVGLKVAGTDSSVDRERMLRAASVWVDMVHENIVRIFDVDPRGPGDAPLIVTELVNGVRLDQFSTETPLTLEQRIGIVTQICRALGHVHARGVIHREVTPENILIVREGLKAMLLDSGIARPVAPEGGLLTHAGSVVGDLAFMAPEQVNGRPEQRSDLFSLAAVLHFLLTNTHPTVLDIAKMHEEIRALAEVPVRLREVLLKALDPIPSRRYESAEAFEGALKDILPLEVVRFPRSRMVVTLHGIRTHASWQRALSEVAAEANLRCLLDRWNFGYFSIFRFILPWSRLAKVAWFRRTYQEEFPELMRNPRALELPSVVAHSFGTYILGNALMRYPYLRFDKVILCGSILPTEFPWPAIIARGQVQSIRNEYGAQDVWTRLVDLFVPGTGRSGLIGFKTPHERLEQEAFDFSHSEYFERSHMQSRWLPFLLRRVSRITPAELTISRVGSRPPWLLYAFYVTLLAILIGAGVALR